MSPTTIQPVTIDSWYEHTDGSYGFYTGAARPNGPTLVKHVATAAECVDTDEHGAVVLVGWPARATDTASPSDADPLQGYSPDEIVVGPAGQTLAHVACELCGRDDGRHEPGCEAMLL